MKGNAKLIAAALVASFAGTAGCAHFDGEPGIDDNALVDPVDGTVVGYLEEAEEAYYFLNGDVVRIADVETVFAHADATTSAEPMTAADAATDLAGPDGISRVDDSRFSGTSWEAMEAHRGRLHQCIGSCEGPSGDRTCRQTCFPVE